MTRKKLHEELDAFISYASEDREEIVDPLANALTKKGLKIWYDKFVLKIGDSLLGKIDDGLSRSKYGIVILSRHFFQKDWPRIELDGLVQKEIGGRKVILPVWHNITRKGIAKYSPTLAGRLAGLTSNGIDKLVEELLLAMDEGGDITKAIEKSSNNIEFNVSFRRVEITTYCHKYSLTISMKLNEPPAKKDFKLTILWPEFIKISRFENLEEGKIIKIGRDEYKEYIFQYDQEVYPGDDVELVSPDGKAILEYEFNTNIYDIVEHGKTFLLWNVFFKDQMPQEGKVDFKLLNIF